MSELVRPILTLLPDDTWLHSFFFVLPGVVEFLYQQSRRITKHWAVCALFRSLRTLAFGTLLLVAREVYVSFSLSVALVILAYAVSMYGTRALLAAPGGATQSDDLSNLEQSLVDLIRSAKGGSGIVLLALFLFALPGPLMDRWTEITVALKWKHQAQFAGFYVAEHSGGYERQGLRVRFEEGGPEPEQDPFVRLEQADSDSRALALGIGDPIELILKNADVHGPTFRAIAAVYQRSPAVWFARSQGNEPLHPDAARNKSFVISTGTTNVDRELELWLRENQIPFEDVESEVFFRLPKNARAAKRVRLRRQDLDSLLFFLAGEVDIWSGYASNELVRAREIVRSDEVVEFSRKLEEIPYGDIIFARGSDLAAHEDAIRRFWLATRAGWQHALDPRNETEVVKIVSDYQGSVDEADELAMLQTLRSFAATGESSGSFGRMDPDAWRLLLDRVQTHLMSSRKVTLHADQLYDLRFLRSRDEKEVDARSRPLPRAPDLTDRQ